MSYVQTTEDFLMKQVSFLRALTSRHALKDDPGGLLQSWLGNRAELLEQTPGKYSLIWLIRSPVCNHFSSGLKNGPD